MVDHPKTRSMSISGGVQLKGEVELSGAKNSGFKLLIAALLSDEPSIISNLSLITDLTSTIEIIKTLGGKVDFIDHHTIKVDGSSIHSSTIPKRFGSLSRAAIYFTGPLIHKFGKITIPFLGGCAIGQRPLDRHIEGFKSLGLKALTNRNNLELSGNLRGNTYHFPKNTHGGTDTLLIAAVLAPGTTILENAALEPEVDDLINFLNSMGAKISRVAKRKIIIKGVRKLHGTTYACMADRNEAITFAIAALATKGDIHIIGAKKNNLQAFLDVVKASGGDFKETSRGLRFYYKNPLRSTSVATLPYPGFMTDWQSLWTTLMTQAKGTSIIHETIFESRFKYVPLLIKFGADIKFFNPEVKDKENYYNFNIADDSPENFHAIKINGPTKFKGITTSIPDLRAGATLVLASLLAEGESILSNIGVIERGYEDLVGKLKSLGASIKII